MHSSSRFNHPAALPLAFLFGLVLFLAGQLTADVNLALFCSFLGGALLIAVAIRLLASFAGLNHAEAHLQPKEELLLESHEVLVQSRAPFFLWRRGYYRARLTDRRVLISLKIWWFNTDRDVTIAIFERGRPNSIRSIELLPGGQAGSAGSSRGRVVLRLAHRRAPRWTLHVPNLAEWKAALESTHPDLLVASPAGT